MNKVTKKYEIAGLKILLTTYFDRTKRQAEKYLSKEPWDNEEADIVIDNPLEFYEEKMNTYPRCSLEDVEYIISGALFNRYLLHYNGCMLHSSAVVVDEYAYLFSADSGTGKSTHTQLWKTYFGDKAYIINDDKPVIKLEDGQWFVYGTPWSGKTAQNENERAKLGAIVFLERSKENWIENMDIASAIPKFFAQTTRRFNQVSNMDKILELMGQALSDTPIYSMGCNISNEAVKTAYERIRRV